MRTIDRAETREGRTRSQVENRWVRRGTVGLAVALLLAGPLGGQVPGGAAVGSAEAVPRGTIRGTVVDGATGLPLSGSSVHLVGAARTVIADGGGAFTLEAVPVGSHTLAVERLGYRPGGFADVIVHSSRTTHVLAELQVRPVALEGIEVEPGFFQRSDQNPVSVTVLSSEEVRRAPGLGIDVSRTLASLPSMARLGEGRNDLLVRGGSSMENGFYIDQIPIPNINHFPSEGQTGGPIGILNVSFIRDVRASVGGFSALHGDRLSAIVDIRYREGNREQIDGEVQMGIAGVGLGLEGPLPGGSGSWMVSGHRSYLDLLVDAIGTGVAPGYGDLQGKLVRDLGPRHTLTLLGITGSSGIEQSLDELDDDDLQDLYGEYAARQSTGGLNWRAYWSDRIHSSTSASVARVASRETFFHARDETLAYQSNNAELIATLRSVHSYVGEGRWRTDVGAEATLTRARYDYHMPGELHGPEDRRAPPIRVDDRMRAERVAAFVSTTLPAGSRLTLTPGLRAEHSGMNGQTEVTPRFSATWTLGHQARIHGASGLFVQSLPLFILSQNVENQSLPHARARHWVIGVEYEPAPALQLSVEGYRKDYGAMPLNPLHPERFPVDDALAGFGMHHGELDAGGRARSTGIEFLAQHKRVDRFHALVSATWFRSRYEGMDGVWRDRLYDNRVIAQATVGYQLGGWEASARWLYGGGAPYTPVDEEASRDAGRTVFDFARTNAERLPSFHTLNLRADRRTHFGSSTLVWYLSLTNAYGRDNVRMYQWNPSLEKVEPMLDLGFLPVLGFEYRF